MIMINLDVMMAKRKKGLTELAGEVDITLANLSILKNNKAKAVRLSTLKAICKVLDCQPGDILQRPPCTPCFTRSAYIGIHRGSPILFSLQEPCTILTIVPQSAGFHPTETVCKRSLSGRFRMGRQNFCSVSPCF